MEENRVIVKGTACNPVRIAARVKRKLGKGVAIISPVPIKKQENKAEPPKVTETLLKMYLHCEGCAKDVRAEVVIPKNQKDDNHNQNDGEEKDSDKKDRGTIGLSYPNEPQGFVYTSDIFSDENTDACSIM
ncbi:hypothetical protein Tco_0734958 [Tanacetum coccineum]